MQTRAARRRLQAACVNDTDPFTLEPVQHQTSTYLTSKGGHVHAMDTAMLAAYIRSTGNRTNPITKEPIDRDTLVQLAAAAGVPLADLCGDAPAAPPRLAWAQEVAQIQILLVLEAVHEIVDAAPLDDPLLSMLAISQRFENAFYGIDGLRRVLGDPQRIVVALEPVWGFLGDLRFRIRSGSVGWVSERLLDTITDTMRGYIFRRPTG